MRARNFGVLLCTCYLGVTFKRSLYTVHPQRPDHQVAGKRVSASETVFFGRYRGFDPKISEKLAADFANQWVEVRQIWALSFVCFFVAFINGFSFRRNQHVGYVFYQGTGTPKNEALRHVSQYGCMNDVIFYMANPIISPRNMTHNCTAIWSPFFQVQGGWKSFCCSLWEASYTGSRTGCGRCGTCKGAGQDVQDFNWTCLISAKSIKSLHTMNANNRWYMAWILAQ